MFNLASVHMYMFHWCVMHLIWILDPWLTSEAVRDYKYITKWSLCRIMFTLNDKYVI